MTRKVLIYRLQPGAVSLLEVKKGDVFIFVPADEYDTSCPKHPHLAIEDARSYAATPEEPGATAEVYTEPFT